MAKKLAHLTRMYLRWLKLRMGICWTAIGINRVLYRVNQALVKRKPPNLCCSICAR